MHEAAVARVWQGRTREAIAQEYADYLYEQGVKKLRATRGNLGVQVPVRERALRSARRPRAGGELSLLDVPQGARRCIRHLRRRTGQRLRAPVRPR